ncbi:hypothetical protein [Helicobacter typhlonius]
MYQFFTRLKSLVHKISWICIYFVPITILYLHFAPQESILDSLPILLVALCITDMIYSNGYIQNDVLTIKNETKPTLRLPTYLLLRMREKFIAIMIGRFALIFILFWLLSMLKYEYLLYFALSMILLQLLYIIYNTQRNITNLLLIPFLSFLQFFSIILPIIDKNFYTLLGLFALYPLPKLLEFSTQKRYKTTIITSKIITNFDMFRVFYYTIYTILFGILYLYEKIDYIFFELGAYYLVFRLVCLATLQNKYLATYIQHKRYKNNPHKK